MISRLHLRIFSLITIGELKVIFIRGVQKTDEPNKPTELLPNFRFGFGSVRFRFHFLKTEIFGFGFGVGFFHTETDRTDRIYIYSCNTST